MTQIPATFMHCGRSQGQVSHDDGRNAIPWAIITAFMGVY